MSYEYKDVFIESISNFIYPGKIFDDALDELDHVYAQAAKADEYDAKAKAFDKIIEEYEGIIKELEIRVEKYESGESE